MLCNIISLSKRIVFICTLFIVCSESIAVEDCTQGEVEVIKESAASSSDSVNLRCNLTLDPEDTITKRLVISGSDASGLTVDCNNAIIDGGQYIDYTKHDMIRVKSNRIERNGNVVWDVPRNITIKNCRIKGSIRVMGLGRNGEAPFVRESSRLDMEHTRRAQSAAPTNIVLDGLKIEALHRTPIYFAPGVTNSKILNSDLFGKATSVAVYLDAESQGNIIKNNIIRVDTSRDHEIPLFPDKGREQMAVDGSSHNIISGNYFSNLNHGGIYLYRNCGEEGTVRVNEPDYNHIVNNYFYYNEYNGANPAVYIASRKGDRPHCHEDDGFQYGSSQSDLDHSNFNVIFDNKFREKEPEDFIRLSNLEVDQPNYLSNNSKVSAYEERKSDCIIDDGLERVRHLERVSGSVNVNGKDYIGILCDDGEWKNGIQMAILSILFS